MGRHSVFNRAPGERTAPILASPTLIAEFWDETDKSAGPDGCWLWTGTVDPNGYGLFLWDGYRIRASRLALEIHMGRPISEGLFALHGCDNPPCCNPAHLREGTPADNTNDSVSRGRWPIGETSGRAKLTEKDVLAIRSAANPYKRGVYARLSRQYGITPRAVSFITSGRTWPHLPVFAEIGRYQTQPRKSRADRARLRAALIPFFHLSGVMQ